MKYKVGDRIRFTSFGHAYGNLYDIQEQYGYLTVTDARISNYRYNPICDVYGIKHDSRRPNGDAHWLYLEDRTELCPEYLKKPKQFKLR